MPVGQSSVARRAGTGSAFRQQLLGELAVLFVGLLGLVRARLHVARRIVDWVKPGDDLTVGDRFGLIRFGSRLDVYLPVGTRVLVGLGQKAVAGETVLADLGGGSERAFRRI